MSTINLSFTSDQVSFIDQLMSKYGFSNRSEFFRSLLRLVVHKPEIVQYASVFPFQSPPKGTVADVMADFRRVDKYSPEFLKDLEDGLKRSKYYSR